MAGLQPGVATSTMGGGDAFDFEYAGGTITGRFAASAAASAASVAIVQRDQTTTYAELDRQSNKLARHLVRQGVGAGDVIALHAGRSVGSIVAILAILKVGAAYAPVDPAAPSDCLAWLIHDCGARLTLAGRSDAADRPGRVLDLDAALAACEREDGSAIEDRCRPDDIAYVMYTSGSTGRPKGAAVPHRAVVRLVIDQTYARFAADEVFLHAAPLAFDASTFEIWGTLLHGARGVVVEEDRASLQQIADTIRHHGVTTAWFTAGLFHLLVDHQLPALRDMRQILAGGDVLSPTHVRRALASLPNCQLVNGYGPTENTTFTCCYRIPKAGWGDGPVPIGTSIHGTYVRLLDDDMKPVADGEIGMLYAGGLGLASGYLGDAGRSAAMFVPDPFHPGATLYRTGDLARRRPDGALDFIGRRDRQVKIDGKRVELGEIEETLRRSVSIADAVVTASKVEDSHVLTAYIKGAAANSDPSMLASEARNGLLGSLPPHMRPARVVVLDEFPLKACGKVDHDRLPKPYPLPTETVQPAEDDTERTLREIFGRKLGVRSVGADTNFFDLGATSLKLVEAHATIERIWPGVNVVALFRHPNIRDLARAIQGRNTPPSCWRTPAGAAAGGRAEEDATHSAGAMSDELPENAIAIVGLAGRFPGADDVAGFWANVRSGKISIARFSDAELEDSFGPDVRHDPNFVRARPILKNVDKFDAEFFGMLPREAALTDPQHRLMLECAWAALEDAGYDPAQYPGAIGVFAGSSMNTYLLTNVLAERQSADGFASDYQVGSYDTLLGALSDTLATRIAYKLNLRGPAMTVQSACSTSLLAVAQACQSLLMYQSDMALAGGVSITFPQKRGYLHQEGGIVSPDGVCRPFDDGAGGTVFGDGAGFVLLKRLGDAIEDGDHIHAVIRGSAVNNDGADKVGFTAPGVRGQSEVIASAIAAAGIDARTIGYVECHGTATPLGDPIEFDGLLRGFGAQQVEQPYCALGSAKANVGHLDAAAGVTGLIKAVMALRHREIPPLTNFTRPNRHLDLAGSPFYFPTTPLPWAQGSTPRRAGVNSFGVGGTNVHVVLEEAPQPERRQTLAAHGHILPLSARNDPALIEAAAALADHLEQVPATQIEDVAHTLQTGRRAFDRRVAVAARSREEAIRALRTLPPATTAQGRPPLVFMFPGQGAQHAGMAHDLHRDHALFRRLVDEGIAIAGPIVGDGLRALLLDPEASSDDATLYAQPGLFIFEYALARLYMSWGLEPDAMVGHSVGEFVAACLSGVFTFEEGCRLVSERARAMQAMPPGAMLAVRLPEAELRAELGDALDLAAINAPQLAVAAGPKAEIDALNARLSARGVMCRPLAVSHAFHSRALDPALPAIERAAAAVALQAPQRAFASSVTGGWASAAQATDPGYWARHGREPVRFADALATVAHDQPFLLEVGPGRNLAGLAAQIVDRRSLRGVAASLPDAETEDLREALGALWSAGIDIDWNQVGAPEGRRIPLPTYRFQRTRHWIERTAPRTVAPLPAIGPAIGSEPVAAAAPIVAASASRLETLQAEIVGILEHLSGAADIDPRESFVDLGFDSLLLGQVARAVERKFRIRITFRQLLKDLPSAAALARHLDTTLPADAVQPKAEAAPPAAVVPPPADDGEARVRLYRPSGAKVPSTLSNVQRDYIETLVRRINERTPLSKARTQRDRVALADPRTAAGFRQEWKELVYPVIAASAKGSKIRDIDGNEYVDLVNGYGQTLFGHSPDFVTEAIAAQLREGFPIGPQSPLAGEVATLVSEMTGDERVTFCNTGSEAVMAAMRVARAVTGRERVVVFAHDYHGQFDEVLVKAGGGAARAAVPVAPGIPPESVANMTVLPYGDRRSLDWIEANGEEIAAVMVEPVQSRHPDLRPREFLQKLRALTEASGSALVFDEIVTGFRVHPGGMQAVFGIRADMATYGKVVGGGMPIGILAGKARFMDALDGGMWRYGDDSIPETAPTFFAGTFVRHPLALAACKAVLLHLKAEGPALQETLAARMGGLVKRLNGELQRRGLATRLEAYSSWFHMSFAAEGPLAALFWPQMRQLGIHVQDGYPCFLTTAHSDADIAAIESAFTATLDALERGGILDAPRHAAAESAPLTEPQLEILAAAQLGDDASCAFNEGVSVEFVGEIDPVALAAALNAVVARHQALRGHIDRSGERMHFARNLTLDLPVRDLSREADPAAALAGLVDADARTAFDLWNGPLVRAALARLAADRHVLVLTAHHIVCDGWSVNILLNDLAALYRAACAGATDDLPPAPRFADYAAAQAETRDERARDLAWWTGQFADLPPLPDLPTDRPRPLLRSFAGATYTTQFDGGLHAALRKTGAASGTTLFSVLFTALQAVLGRLANASDVVMGVPVAGQSVDDQPDLVGHCVQMLPFRAAVDWQAPFERHVEAVAQRLLDGFDHARCTYGTLVRALPIQRVADRLPLTEIQFNLEKVADALDFGGPRVSITPNGKAAVNFDLFVNIVESASGLRIDCDYNSDLYDEATVARWMAHYRRLLEGIVAAPTTTMAALPLLTAAQERFVLDEVNDSAAVYPHDSCLHELFAAQAAKTPDAVAVVDRRGSLTYAELDRHSTRLAQEMLGVSEKRHGRIAIAVDRSRLLPVALLAALKAGHAYVPLDASQPIERLKQIALAAQVDGLVCQDDRIAGIAPYAFALRADRLALDEVLQRRPLPKVSADATAYVLFTSGSTGTPKGVEVGHRSLTNLITDVVRRLELTASDVTIGSSAVTFDVAATELYAPLVSGGRLVLSEADEVRTGVELIHLARGSAATLMQATPTLWRMLLDAGFASWPGLRMITVGEAISRATVDRLIEGGGRLWNLYGPTETTIYSSGREMLPGETGVTIGRPLANQRLYVLDDRDQPAPPGAVGNLFIGGDGLAKGYFDRSDLTDAAFRVLVLAGRAPQRLYRTGDLARLLPSGEFELHGRIDHQVKLRGFRIELEEIEAVLRQASGVRDAAVILRTDIGPDPLLVGYVAGDARAAQLSAFLADRLPTYMVPSRWVTLDALPLTPNGKTDRNALPLPAPAAAAPVSSSPRTPLEGRIAAVWAAVIGLPAVGVHDPLFALGADSLQVFRIAAQLDQEGIAVGARELMKNPTVAALAEAVDGTPAAAREANVRRGPSLADFRHGARRRTLNS